MKKRGRGRGRVRRNQPPGKPRLTTIWACVDPEVKAVIASTAKDTNRSMSWVVAELINELLGVESRPKMKP